MSGKDSKKKLKIRGKKQNDNIMTYSW